MSLSGTLSGLIRRWYIVLAGMIFAGVAGCGVWIHTPPEYERSASQMLMPGVGTLPSPRANPYLYLGGMLETADVVVRVAGNSETVIELEKEYPGTKVTIARDASTFGPIILTTVSANSDAVAKEVLGKVVAETGTQLSKLQTADNIRPRDQVTINTLTIDPKPTLHQRKRLVATGGATIAILAFALAVASAVDGLLRIRARKTDATIGTDRIDFGSAVALDDDSASNEPPDKECADQSAGTNDGKPEPQVAEASAGSSSAAVLEPLSMRH